MGVSIRLGIPSADSIGVNVCNVHIKGRAIFGENCSGWCAYIPSSNHEQVGDRSVRNGCLRRNEGLFIHTCENNEQNERHKACKDIPKWKVQIYSCRPIPQKWKKRWKFRTWYSWSPTQTTLDTILARNTMRTSADKYRIRFSTCLIKRLILEIGSSFFHFRVITFFGVDYVPVHRYSSE